MTNPLDEAIFSSGEPQADSRSRRRKQSRRGRGLFRAVTLLLAVALVAGGAFAAFKYVKPMYESLTASNDFTGPGEGSASVVVKSGDSGSVIGQTLRGAGVIKTTQAFIEAANANAKAAAAIQPGTYTLKKQMKASDALAALTQAENRSVQRVTIREGLWAQEIYPVLSKASGIPVAEYVAAAKDPATIGLPAEAKGNIEGWLYPDTYDFGEDASAAEQLKTMVGKTIQELDAAGVPAAERERALILASLVEAEARLDADRNKVARVIDNRLAKSGPPPYGYLQLDSTVSYGVKKRAITTSDRERADGNPWNTYVHPGLPAGPINNPGAKSVAAALAPADGGWLFFVTINPDTGETKFANTQSEHDNYVLQFQAWCQDNPGKC